MRVAFLLGEDMTTKAIVDESQDAIWSEYGVSVLINDMGPFLVIDEEENNTFENVTGSSRQICFKRIETVAVSRGDTITFVDTGQTATCLSGLRTSGVRQVVRYEPN